MNLSEEEEVLETLEAKVEEHKLKKEVSETKLETKISTKTKIRKEG